MHNATVTSPDLDRYARMPHTDRIDALYRDTYAAIVALKTFNDEVRNLPKGTMVKVPATVRTAHVVFAALNFYTDEIDVKGWERKSALRWAGQVTYMKGLK